MMEEPGVPRVFSCYNVSALDFRVHGAALIRACTSSGSLFNKLTSDDPYTCCWPAMTLDGWVTTEYGSISDADEAAIRAFPSAHGTRTPCTAAMYIERKNPFC